MNIPITVRKSIQTIDGLDLHRELGLKKYYSDWIKYQIKRAGLIEGEDYIKLHKKGELSATGQIKIDYYLTVESGKHIAMMSPVKKGKEVREYFLKCEKELKRLRAMHGTPEWQEARRLGKDARKTLTDYIKELEKIADIQGGAKIVINKQGKEVSVGRKYYSTVTKMIYKNLFGDSSLKDVRDTLDERRLMFLSVIEEACGEEINRCVAIGLDYHEIYAEAKKRVIAVTEAMVVQKITNLKVIK